MGGKGFLFRGLPSTPSQWKGAAPCLPRLLPLLLPALTQMSSKMHPLPKVLEPQEWPQSLPIAQLAQAVC